jgi:single-strand DNA-binding protein
MNKVTLIGRMVAAPELKATTNGTSVTSFSIAVQKRFKDADGNYGVDFIDCVAWKQTAEFLAKFFTRGQQVAIGGSIQTRTYKTQSGENRKVT